MGPNKRVIRGMRFTGHETFPLRYSWLPKAARRLDGDERALADDEQVMTSLGLGKNMVQALRFWVEATQVATAGPNRALKLTAFGHQTLGRSGLDPYLEDIRTLWLLHWKLSTSGGDQTPFAWDYLLSRWPTPEFTRSQIVAAFAHEAQRTGRALSTTTLSQHFDIFIHSYAEVERKGVGDDDVLDCPFIELRLVTVAGEARAIDTGRPEVLYSLARADRPSLTPETFAYCVDDFWRTRRAQDKTLAFADLLTGRGSVGQVFKLREADLWARLEGLESASRGAMRFLPSAAQPSVVRAEKRSPNLLRAVYGGERA